MTPKVRSNSTTKHGNGKLSRCSKKLKTAKGSAFIEQVSPLLQYQKSYFEVNKYLMKGHLFKTARRALSSASAPVDFSAVHSLPMLERYFSFNTLSWNDNLQPAYHFDADVAKRVAFNIAEAGCTTCAQIPVMRMVGTLNACEQGVSLHDLASLQVTGGIQQNIIYLSYIKLVQSLRFRRAQAFPNQSEIQLEVLHQEEGSGASTSFESHEKVSHGHASAPHSAPPRLDDVYAALYLPRGRLALALNFPVRGDQVRKKKNKSGYMYRHSYVITTASLSSLAAWMPRWCWSTRGSTPFMAPCQNTPLTAPRRYTSR